jgi:2-polyprenyl-3-methyl-5-hydroxy-6-metoxy-1,4-benzoquinol methylase
MTELGVQEAINFWDERHKARGELLSGGDLSFDHATNEIFYALRLGRLIDIVGCYSSVIAPLRILDAGCGKGYFSRGMARFGFDVDGIDSSQHAIEQCREQVVGRERYEVSTLDAWRPPYLYDVVYCVDVMFHIMDDVVWAKSVVNLSSLVCLSGQLVIADHAVEADRVWGSYQKTRAPQRYRDLLKPRGFTQVDHVPYHFRDSPVALMVFTRTA